MQAGVSESPVRLRSEGISCALAATQHPLLAGMGLAGAELPPWPLCGNHFLSWRFGGRFTLQLPRGSHCIRPSGFHFPGVRETQFSAADSPQGLTCSTCCAILHRVSVGRKKGCRHTHMGSSCTTVQVVHCTNTSCKMSTPHQTS